MRKIGVFGGTFNPIHNGHIKIAEEIKTRAGLDKVLFVPAGRPPHKEVKDDVGAERRMEMCRAVCEELGEGFEACDIELRRGKTSYTVDTLSELKERYPKDELYLIIGSDMLTTFTRWREWEKILKLAVICAAGRRAGESLESAADILKSAGGKVLLFDVSPIEISSTEIRKKASRGIDIKSDVPQKVYEYKNAEKLYKDRYAGVRSAMKELLTEKRYLHSEAVALRAAELAERYGAGSELEEKAYFAGLVHDICKDMSAERQLEIIKKGTLKITGSELSAKSLYHSKAGAEYIISEFGVTDEDIINAVRYHTEARAKMSELEKIVYIADLTSEDRDYSDVEIMREISQRDKNEAMRYALEFIVGDLKRRGFGVSDNTREAYMESIAQSKD